MTGDGPWGEDMPYAWRRVPAKALFAERRELCHADDKHLTPSQKYGVLPQDEYMERTGSKVVLNLAGQHSMKHVEPDDFIIHLRSFQGGFEHSRLAGKISTAYTVLRARGPIHSGYYRWLFKSDIYISALAGLTNQLRDGQSIKFGDFARIDLPLPPLDEQRRIADFLDDQVALLDRAIALRLQQIGLLEERRQSLLEGTFGGPAPRRALRRVIQRWIDYRGATPTKTSTGIPLVTAKNIRQGVVSFEASAEYIAEDDYVDWMRRGYPLVGDVLLTTEAPLGEVAQVEDEGVALAQRVILLRPDEASVTPRWLYWYLRSPQGQSELRMRATGTTAQGIKAERLREVPIPTPGLVEQAHLLSQVEVVEQQWHDARVLLARSSALLTERRKALITAAVTGEFDVTTARPVAVA